VVPIDAVDRCMNTSPHEHVIPAKAGIHEWHPVFAWIPAFAGMTWVSEGVDDSDVIPAPGSTSGARCSRGSRRSPG
jgi:hypothetical protein